MRETSVKVRGSDLVWVLGTSLVVLGIGFSLYMILAHRLIDSVGGVVLIAAGIYIVTVLWRSRRGRMQRD